MLHRIGILILSFSFGFNCSFAHAQKSEAIIAIPSLDPAFVNLKILGRGIENRKTGEFLGISCVGLNRISKSETNCNQLRHVYLETPSSSPIFIGPKYSVSETESPSKLELNATLRMISKEYKRNTWLWEGGQKRAIGLSLGGMLGTFYGSYLLAVPLGYGTAVGTSISLIPGAGPIIIAGTLVFFAGSFLFASTERSRRIGNADVVNMMKDANGWNWAIRPDAVSKSKFKSYFDWVKSSDPYSKR